MPAIDLILRAQSGDHRAFTVLMRTHEHAVRALCSGFAKDPDTVDDLVLETFIEAYLKLNQLRDPKAFGAWLRTIARNLCLSWCRERRIAETPLSAEPAAPEPRDPCDDRIAAGLGRLSSDHRLVLDLHYRAGMSYRDVAEELKVPIGTVMSRLHRAKHALKEAVENIEEGEMEEESKLEHRFRMEIELLEGLGDAVEQVGRGWVVRVKGQHGAVLRIRKLLENDPSSLLDLLQVCETPDHYVHLAWVVRQDPNFAVPVLAAAVLSDNEELRERAALLAERWVIRPWPIIRSVDLFLDTVIASPAPEPMKAQLLVRLISALKEKIPDTLGGSYLVIWELTRVLMGYPQAAFPVLWDALWELDEDDIVEYGVRTAIAYLAEPYIDAFIEEVRSGDSRRIARLLRDLHLLRVDELPERVHPVLSDLLESEDAAVAEHARTLCAKFRVPLAAPLLQQRLASDDVEIRASTARELALVAGDDALPHLLKLLDDPSSRVRSVTLMALGRIEATAARTDILERIKSDPDESVREHAIGVYGKLASPEERETCFEWVRSTGNRRLMKAAAKSLYDGEGPREASDLEEARLRRIRGDAEPVEPINPIRGVRALPEIRSYDEDELTRIVAGVCEDYSTTRRLMVTEGRFALMRRDKGIYTFTPIGEAVWRVGKFIEEAREGVAGWRW